MREECEEEERFEECEEPFEECEEHFEECEEWTEKVGSPMLELWGMTELAGPGIMQHSYGENRLGAAGIEMPYFRAKIVDPEDVSRELPIGEVGELMVSGSFVMMGYFGNEEATKEAIEPDGWLHSQRRNCNR